MSTGYLRKTLIMIMVTSAVALINSGLLIHSRNKLFLSQLRLMASVPLESAVPCSSSFNETNKSADFARKVVDTHFPLSSLPTLEDVQVIELRQIGRPVLGLFAVENTRCKHGFPQAYVQYPVSGAVSSGMVRLGCPHLVKAVDEMESEGGLDYFDSKLANEPDDGLLKTSFNDANHAWVNIRYDTVSTKDREYMEKKLGIDGAKFLMASGIIGCTIGKFQVKCLHAHIGDHLMRGTNQIGAQALERLESRGVDVKGCDSCWQQCDLKHEPTADSWWYTSQKNKNRIVKARIEKTGEKIDSRGVTRKKSQDERGL